MESFFLLAVFFIAPVAVFAGGWLLFTAAFCLKAIVNGSIPHVQVRAAKAA